MILPNTYADSLGVTNALVAALYTGHVQRVERGTSYVSMMLGEEGQSLLNGRSVGEVADEARAKLVELYSAPSCNGDTLGMPPRWALTLLLASATGAGMAPSEDVSWTEHLRAIGVNFMQLQSLTRWTARDWRNARHTLWAAVAQAIYPHEGEWELPSLVNAQLPMFNAVPGGDVLALGLRRAGGAAATEQPSGVSSSAPVFSPDIYAHGVVLTVERPAEATRASPLHYVVHGFASPQARVRWLDAHPAVAERVHDQVLVRNLDLLHAMDAPNSAGLQVTAIPSWAYASALNVWERHAAPYPSRRDVDADTHVVAVLRDAADPSERRQTDRYVFRLSREHTRELAELFPATVRGQAREWAEAYEMGQRFLAAVRERGGVLEPVTALEYSQIEARARAERAQRQRRDQQQPRMTRPLATGGILPQNPTGPVDARQAVPPNSGTPGAPTTAPVTQTTGHAMPTDTRPFLPEMPRRFGVELEASGLNTREAHAALGAGGMHSQYQGNTHNAAAGQDGSPWRVVYDGSLSAGFEAVSPPTRSTHEVWKACRLLREAGAVVNTQCGTHVHVDATGMSVGQGRTLAKLWVRFEPVLDRLVSASRRRNRWCQSNRQYAMGGGRPNSGTFAHAWERIEGARDLRRLSTAMGSERYYKLNFRAFWQHGTVEFRMHGGTLNGAKLARWIATCVGMVEYAMATPHTNVPQTDGTLDELLELVGDALPSVFGGSVQEPTTQRVLREVERHERTPWVPREGSLGHTVAHWLDAMWNGLGEPAQVTDEQQRVMRAAAMAACNDELNSGAWRQNWRRWSHSRIGRTVTVTETEEVEVPGERTPRDSERFETWYADHVRGRDAVLNA